MPRGRTLVVIDENGALANVRMTDDPPQGTSAIRAFPVNLTQTAATFRMHVMARKGNNGKTSQIFAEQGPRNESIPAGFAGEQIRFTGCDLLVLRCFATTNVEAIAGAGAIRSNVGQTAHA